MRKIYKIIGQDFSNTHDMGVVLRIKNLYSGQVFYKTPIDLFHDKILIRRLHPADILRIGYMVGEYQMYLTYRLMTEKREKPSVAIKPVH